MSEAWAEALESEAYEGTGEAAYETESTGEAAYETESTGEGAYEGLGEDARSDRRARQRQIMLARQQRQAQLRRRPPAPPPPQRVVRAPCPEPAITATIRNLDLETKVAQDSLRRALKRANDRAERANLATIASTAASQIFDSFPNDLAGHEFVRAGIRGAPLLLLSSSKERSGFERYALDPKVIGVAVIAVIVGAGKFRSTSTGVHTINIVDPGPIHVRDYGVLLGTAVDRNNREVQGITITWHSSNAAILNVDPPTGNYTAVGAGPVVVKATTDGVTVPLSVTVLAE